MVAGCGGSSTTPSTGTIASAELPARRDALVAFYHAFLGALPSRKASIEAALRARSAARKGHVNLPELGRALQNAVADAQAWQRRMEALPGGNGDLERIRRKYSEAAAEEVQFWRQYSAFLPVVAARTAKRTEGEAVEATGAKAQALSNAARAELAALTERLGGTAAFRSRVDPKRLEELKSSSH
jgi:hypothetical protein